MKDRILTMKNLRKRNALGHRHTLCTFCNQHEETTDHLLLRCKWVRKVWLPLENLFGLDSRPRTVEAAWTTWRKRAVPSDIREAWDMCSTAIFWSIWRERNDRIFRGVLKSQDRLMLEISNVIRLWCNNTSGKKGDRITSFFKLVNIL